MASEPFDVTDTNGIRVTGAVGVSRQTVPSMIREAHTIEIPDLRSFTSSIPIHGKSARLIEIRLAKRCRTPWVKL